MVAKPPEAADFFFEKEAANIPARSSVDREAGQACDSPPGRSDHVIKITASLPCEVAIPPVQPAREETAWLLPDCLFHGQGALLAELLGPLCPALVSLLMFCFAFLTFFLFL